MYEPDLILIVETKTTGKTSLNIKGYREKITRNRKDNGGGILIAKKDDSKINLLAIKIHETKEHVWVKVNNITIALIYAPIESQTKSEEIEEWYYELEKEYAIWQNEKVILMGDFNAHVGSDENGIDGNHNNVNKSGEILRSLIQRRNLHLMNNSKKCTGKWTREDPNGTKSILDMIIANN